MMRLVYFAHAITSCWNNGNAHFQRGVLRELLARGYDVRVFEQADGWSRVNLLRDHGQAPLHAFSPIFPELAPVVRPISPDVDAMLNGADAVIVHEWTEPDLIARIGHRRARGARFTLLFHDTHHRAVSDPNTLGGLDVSAYDGVLAFGHALATVYCRRGWGGRAFVWHEAADTRLFKPPLVAPIRRGIVWIGNWGDEERSRELRDYLIEPAIALGLPLDTYGVRFPDTAVTELARAQARHYGWLANAAVPAIFARHAMTIHVPRRFYATHLPGIPTIRVFEALACGIPLLCAPWNDTEALFQPGRDFLIANSPEAMRRDMRALAADPALGRSIAANGLAIIKARHTCAHRVDELLAILARLGTTSAMKAA